MTTPTEDPPKTLDYGFGDDIGDLSEFKPKPSPKTKAKPRPKAKRAAPKIKSPIAIRPAVLEERDKIAKSMGFASREAQPPVLLKKRRRTHHDEPVDQLSIRGPVRVLNDFITYCEGEGVSYWEGLEQMLNQDPHLTLPKK